MNGIYTKAREKFLRGEIAWHTADIRAVLIDADDYTVNLATHEFLSSIPPAARVSTSNLLTGKTTVGGWAGCATITFPATTGDPSEAIVLFKDTGDAATSPLIAYFDQGSNFPVVPNGAAINALVGSSGLFRL